MDKKQLRKEIRARVALIPDSEKAVRSMAVCDVLRTRLSACGARVVALFSPLHDEPQVWSLVEELSKFILVVLPRVEGDIMKFYPYCNSNLLQGSWGIMEPQGVEPVAPGEIDVAVVPGVVFTRDGARMGRGRGYYDKYLSQEGFRATKIGVCYAEQLVDELVTEPHDVTMDFVVYK